MKKIVVSISLSCLLIFSAFVVFAKDPKPRVEINGVSVYSPISYTVKDGTVMVDVESFFNVMQADYKYDGKKDKITYNGKTIPVRNKSGGVVANFDSLADIIDATSTKIKEDGTHYILVLPEGTIKLTESYENMGEHWANPEEDIFFYEENESAFDDNGEPIPVFKTIYGVYKDELVFFEQMVAQVYMEGTEARDWTNVPGMKGLPSPPVDHTDIEFRPIGHDNYEIPHYDFHHYFISYEEQFKIEGQPLHHD